MKKTILLLLLTVVLAISLCGCGGSGSASKEVSVDISKLSEELLTTVTSDQLSETAEAMVPSIYGLSEDAVEECKAYTSSGATACEVVVIQSKDSSSTSSVEEKLKSHVSSQSELYATYNEGEVAKLDQAIIKSASAYTVLVVCDDTEAAEKILTSYGF